MLVLYKETQPNYCLSATIRKSLKKTDRLCVTPQPTSCYTNSVVPGQIRLLNYCFN